MRAQHGGEDSLSRPWTFVHEQADAGVMIRPHGKCEWREE